MCSLKNGLLYVFPTGTPIAALTGTADKDTCSVIISQLAMRHPLTIRISPNRPNLRFSVVHTKKEEIFGELTWLINPERGIC